MAKKQKIQPILRSDGPKDYVPLSDTDSLYIEIKDVLKHCMDSGIEIDESNIDNYILKIASKIEKENNLELSNVCPRIFNIPENLYFSLKQEVIVRRMLITGKRRYAMWITNNEGVPIPPDHKDSITYKGLELFKSNMNPLFKEFGTKFINNILFKVPKSEIDQSIIDFNNSLKNIDPRKIGKPTGVKHITKCIKRKPMAGMIFSEFEINTKENSKAAIIYNDLLKFKKLDKKYESVVEGDKIYVLNLKENPYKISVIGLPNAKIPPEIETFIHQYVDIGGIFESSLLNKLKELYKDINWEFVELNPNISRFFTYS
jgi:hypothetical protein